MWTATTRSSSRWTARPQLTGYEYEVLEMADSLNKGCWSAPPCPTRDTLRLMQIMDELRAQMGIRYPCEGVDDGRHAVTLLKNKAAGLLARRALLYVWAAYTP